MPAMSSKSYAAWKEPPTFMLQHAEREGEGSQALDKRNGPDVPGQRPEGSPEGSPLTPLLPPFLVLSLLWESCKLPQAL